MGVAWVYCLNTHHLAVTKKTVYISCSMHCSDLFLPILQCLLLPSNMNLQKGPNIAQLPKVIFT